MIEENEWPCPHYEEMAEYAKDAEAHAEPWRLWESMCKSDDSWSVCQGHPKWNPRVEYRRKPKCIIINGREVPEPLRELPKTDRVVFTFDLGRGTTFNFRWYGYLSDAAYLRRGLLHSTKEAAQKHLDALLSFTKVTE